MELQGYHATKREHVASIEQSGFRFSDRSTNWLGKGVYFWERLTDAQRWADSRNLDAILSCWITVEKAYFLDLDDDEHRKAYRELADAIKEHLASQGLETKDTFDFHAIELIALKRRIDVVRCTFWQNEVAHRQRRKLPPSRILKERKRAETQLAVRNLECIRRIDETDVA